MSKGLESLPDNLPLLLNVGMAARIRGCDRRSIIKGCKDGSIRGASQLGYAGEWRIPRDSFLEQCGLKAVDAS